MDSSPSLCSGADDNECCHSEAVAEESRNEVDSSVTAFPQNDGNRDFEGITNIRCHSEGDSPKSL
jgi:hypothetical protein